MRRGERRVGLEDAGARRRRRWLPASLVLTLPIAGYAMAASFTEYRGNKVSGATPAELVENMRAHPVPSDAAGIAYASITDRYDIAFDTRAEAGESCSLRKVSVDFRFTITLPEAREEEKMSEGTLRMWREFVGFSKRHEEGHRAIYLDCGRKYEAAASKLRSEAGCQALRVEALELFRQHYAACKIRHADYDKAESLRLEGLSLFKAAN